MPMPSSSSKFTGTAVLIISLLSLQGALWYFRPQPTGDVTPLNRYSVVNIHGGYRKLLDFNSSLESDQRRPSNHLDAHGRTSDHRKLVSLIHTVLFGLNGEIIVIITNTVYLYVMYESNAHVLVCTVQVYF